MKKLILLSIIALLSSCAITDECRHSFCEGDQVVVGNKYPGIVLRTRTSYKEQYVTVNYICEDGDKTDAIHYLLLKKRE